ncbi:hypothetical protein CK203_104988 [Vitis vinifera]|uniref:Wall-associated receptor kinase galacturonan-binding domain-containing protein n=1 Tax=Vitis vinifera TaxID=29760 RepID=A0A438CWU0_VITVI|nr:hypothetical protein CK203_104988 [Vitis vinifera]
MPQTKAAFLSASELMMLREAKLVGVGFITLLYARDPLGCGHTDPPYELVCENNRTIFYRKYHVAEINYHNYTMRVVVPGPIFDHNYIPIVPCTRTNATFSSSQPYAYALAGDCKQVRDLSYSCTIGMTVVTGNFKAASEPSNLSCSDLQEKLLMGLQLSFLSFCCHECEVKGRWCIPNFSKNTIQCPDDDERKWLGLNNLINDVLVPVAEFFSKAFGVSFIVFQF